jgi:hypothetical protein
MGSGQVHRLQAIAVRLEDLQLVAARW